MEMKETVEYLEKKSENIGRYSDKMREAVKEIDRQLEEDFKQAGITFVDSKVVNTTYTPLGSQDHKLCITKADVPGGNTVRAWGIFIADSEDEYLESPSWIGHAGRDMLKAVIPRLPMFLKLYSEKLAEKASEYEEMSKIAEEMSNIVRGK
jgi:hypothetical protein